MSQDDNMTPYSCNMAKQNYLQSVACQLWIRFIQTIHEMVAAEMVNIVAYDKTMPGFIIWTNAG